MPKTNDVEWFDLCHELKGPSNEWTRFSYKPEKPIEEKFKKDINAKFDDLKFSWKRLDTLRTKYKISEAFNATADLRYNHTGVVLLNFEW